MCAAYLEVYSENVEVGTDSSIPFNNVARVKEFGNVIDHDCASTILLQKSGTYKMTCTANVTAKTSGLIAIQLVKDGDKIPNAIAGTTTSSNEYMHNLTFTTLVFAHVAHFGEGNPVPIHVQNIGVPATFDTIDIIVERVASTLA